MGSIEYTTSPGLIDSVLPVAAGRPRPSPLILPITNRDQKVRSGGTPGRSA